MRSIRENWFHCDEHGACQDAECKKCSDKRIAELETALSVATLAHSTAEDRVIELKKLVTQLDGNERA